MLTQVTLVPVRCFARPWPCCSLYYTSKILNDCTASEYQNRPFESCSLLSIVITGKGFACGASVVLPSEQTGRNCCVHCRVKEGKQTDAGVQLWKRPDCSRANDFVISQPVLIDVLQMKKDQTGWCTIWKVQPAPKNTEYAQSCLMELCQLRGWRNRLLTLCVRLQMSPSTSAYE